MNEALADTRDDSTPKKLDESLPNPERGIFHIQNAEYWAFYNLEQVSRDRQVYFH